MATDQQDSHSRVVTDIKIARVYRGQAMNPHKLPGRVGPEFPAAMATMHYLAALTELLVSEHPEFDGEL